MAALTDLLGLQETDLLLDKALARLTEIEESLVESDEIVEARSEYEVKAGALRDLQAKQREAEEVVEGARGKAAEIEKRLYGGSVRDARELQGLDADLKSLKELVVRREDELLAVLEEVEAAQAEADSAGETLRALEEEWQGGQAQMLEEKAELEPEAEKLRGERDEQANEIDRAVLGLYDKLRPRKGGRAVARLERGMCGGCRITLPAATMSRVRTGGIVQCVSCERILLT
jgi:predicted  nucleic acid-binding Zn-ribbon protein